MEWNNAPAVTRLLQRWKVDGDPAAEQQLFTAVEHELRQIAQRTLRRQSGFEHKLEARELVNEAYLALRDYPIVTANRGPFFSLMAKAMRHFLMDLADHDRAAKRPPSRLRISETDAKEMAGGADGIGPLDYYAALDALKAINPRQANAIELRVLGLSNEEIAEELHVSLATVKRDLKEARAYLAFKLGLPAKWIRA